MIVQELINKLDNFPKDMRVVDMNMEDIAFVRCDTWVDNNYPYNKPNEMVVRIM